MLHKLTPLTFSKQHVLLNTKLWAQRNWMKVLGLLLCAYVLVNKDLNFQLNLNGNHAASAFQPVLSSDENYPQVALASSNFIEEAKEPEVEMKVVEKPIVKTQILSTPLFSKKEKKDTYQPTKKEIEQNLANTYSNMTYTFDKSAIKKSTQKNWSKKRKKQEAYVQRFASIAQTEMKKYGIPASITLAQGLIETNAGDSRLARKNNNHFGMKCFSKKCGKGHCSNFTDDSHKDFFRKYKSSWESYRAHSLLLMGKRYKHLKKLGVKNYKDWAKGLRKAGYATDKRYAIKLIDIIDELKLHRFDNV